MTITIQADELTGVQVLNLLEKHLELMLVVTPHESVHALDGSSLRRPDVTAWTAWEDNQLLGVGALQALSPTHGEIESMHTARAARGRAVATAFMTCQLPRQTR
ncbi:MAG: GNAT family N-acetyltransferase [Burkholderiaceae bacterium]